VTFLLSGLWHGASWNYVLWGAYHGLLLVITRAHEILSEPQRTGLRSSALGPRLSAIGHRTSDFVSVAVMFALTLFGWLLFRETDLHAIARDLILSPWRSTALDRQVGLYLFLLTLGYSAPLWVQSVWVESHRHARSAGVQSGPGWGMAIVRAAACGAAFAAILALRSQTSLDFIYFQF
jgi:alginate O-acetyltransferase complex protein AlgI